MLPCFHSVGHYFFTKSAHLYLQDMIALEQRMDPTEFKIFIEQNFTIRRSDKFWSGLWSDLIADVVYEKLLWIGTCAWNLQQSASTVDRKNGVHDKHTCIRQVMYPPELKLKRANE
jgi:hypothetical protein